MTASIPLNPGDLAEQPAPVPGAYLGVWRRTLLETASGRDERSQVWWLQTPRWHADLPSLIARARPSRALWLDWLNVEISFGHRSGSAPWRIERSTLPFREGQTFSRPGAIQRRGHQIAVEGCNERRWMILDWSLDAPL